MPGTSLMVWTTARANALRRRRSRAVESLAEIARRVSPRAVLSYESAAELFRLAVIAPRPGIHVTVPVGCAVRRAAGVVVHRGDVDHGVVARGGVLVTDRLRTALELMRSRPAREGLVVADSLLARGYASPKRLQDTADALRGAGSGRVRAAARLADRGGQSAFESLTRFAVVASRLGPVQTQVRFGPHEHAFDMWLPWSGVLIECDGWEFHRDRGAFRADRLNANEVAARRDLRLVRLVWEDVWPVHDRAVAAIRAAALLGKGNRVRSMRRRLANPSP